MIWKHGPNASSRPQALICILYVNLVDQGDSITKPGQEFFQRICSAYACAQRLAVASQSVENGFESGKRFARQNALESLLLHVTDGVD